MIEKLQWSFSDGGTFTTRGDVTTINHRYTTLLSTNPCTGRVASSVRVTVTPTFTDVGVGSPQPACVDVARPPAYFGYNTNFWGLTVEFGAHRQTEDGWRFRWDYGDGVPPTTNRLYDATCRTYEAPGRYLVRLTSWSIHDDPVVYETFERYVDVPNLPPAPSFTLSQDLKTVSVDASATRDEPAVQESLATSGCTSLRTNSEVQYEWDFGDDSFARGRSASHVYVAPGTYTVRLVASDRAGARAVAEKTVTIPNDPPSAKFLFHCRGLDCEFDASESSDDGTIVSYEWNFNGTIVLTDSPRKTHRFSTSGPMAVTLKTGDGALVSPLARAMANVTSVAPGAALAYFPISPCRLYDSRVAGGRLASGTVRNIPATAAAGATKCGIPASARAAALNFIILSPSNVGYLRAWHGAPPTPLSTVLNFAVENVPRANNAVVEVSPAGNVAALATITGTSGSADLIVDVSGYFAADSVPAPEARGPYRYAPVPPCRLYDSRNGALFSANELRYLAVDRTDCGLPTGPAAVAANLNVDQSAAAGRATLFSSLLGLPSEASTINFRPGANLTNGALVELGGRAGDDLGVKFVPVSSATAHIAVDASGSFSSSGALSYHAVPPCRLLDTRHATYGIPRLQTGQTTSVQVQGNCGVPRGASAIAANVTVLAPDSIGFLHAGHPGEIDTAPPVVTFRPEDPVTGNGAILAVSAASRDLAIRPTLVGGTSLDLVLEVFGYYSADTDGLSGEAKELDK